MATAQKVRKILDTTLIMALNDAFSGMSKRVELIRKVMSASSK